MRTLSKSKIIAFRQCPKRLWLEIHRPDLRADSSSTQASFDIGHQVGEIARHIYDPEGQGGLIDIDSEGFEAAFARTQKLVRGSQPVFEAGFRILNGVQRWVNGGHVQRWAGVECPSVPHATPLATQPFS